MSSFSILSEKKPLLRRDGKEVGLQFPACGEETGPGVQRVEGMYFFGLKMVSRGDEGKVMTHRRGRGDARKNILETPGARAGLERVRGSGRWGRGVLRGLGTKLSSVSSRAVAFEGPGRSTGPGRGQWAQGHSRAVSLDIEDSPAAQPEVSAV